jgi:carbon monoxide dehydrogenase subunit G
VKLENSFDVPASPEAAWDLLMDVPRVIPCMPGAELIETIDESHWKARMKVKLGPISLSFLTDVTRQEIDEAERRVVLAAKAREERGRGAANATIESSLVSEGDRTRVATVTDLAYCLEQQLVAEQGDSSEGNPEPVAPRPVSGLAVGAAAMRSMVGRHKRVTAALWATFFFVYLWLGMLAIDVSGLEAFIVSALLGAAIYLFIWIGLEDDPARNPWART